MFFKKLCIYLCVTKLRLGIDDYNKLILLLQRQILLYILLFVLYITNL